MNPVICCCLRQLLTTPLDPSPSPSRSEGAKARLRKRKAHVEPNDGGPQKTKRRAARNTAYSQDTLEIVPTAENTPGPETEAYCTLKNEIETLKGRLKTANERIEKNKDIVNTLFQANDILGKRLAKAENLIQDHDRKHSGAIQSLRADLNRTDGQVRTIRIDRDDTISALTKVVNNYVTAPDAT
jgi:chromosome segregation ATPase